VGVAASGAFTAFTRWGGYSNVFPNGGYTTTLDIYLDLTAAGNDTRFDWSSAVSTPQCTHRRDFVFNVGFYTDTRLCNVSSSSRFIISASSNAGRDGANPCNPGRDPIALSETGWYTFTHHFLNTGGVLTVTLEVRGPGGDGSWTPSDSSDVIGETVGGNHYCAFALQEFPGLTIDTSTRI
jgi:hypothetical protein